MAWEDLNVWERIGCIACPIIVALIVAVLIFIIYKARRKEEVQSIDALIYSGEVNKMNTVMDYLRRERMQQILEGEESDETDIEDQKSAKKKKSKKKHSKNNKQREMQQPTFVMMNPSVPNTIYPHIGQYSGISQSVPPISTLHRAQTADGYMNNTGMALPNNPYVTIDIGDGPRSHAVEPLPAARIRLARETAEYPMGPAPMAPPGYRTVPIVIERARDF